MPLSDLPQLGGLLDLPSGLLQVFLINFCVSTPLAQFRPNMVHNFQLGLLL